jgi:hypothetical protein
VHFAHYLKQGLAAKALEANRDVGEEINSLLNLMLGNIFMSI